MTAEYSQVAFLMKRKFSRLNGQRIQEVGTGYCNRPQRTFSEATKHLYLA